MYVKVCRNVFGTKKIIYRGAFLRNSQKIFIVDVRLDVDVLNTPLV